MSNILVNNCLFYPGVSAKVMGTWNLFGDGTTEADRKAFQTWGNKKLQPLTKTVVINLLNEDQMSPFKGAFMGPLDNARVNLIASWSQRFIADGWKIVYAIYDGPASGKGKYRPILSAPQSQHALFLSIAIPFLNPWATAYMVGCESNRYFKDPAIVEAAVACIKQYAGGRPIGTHMCWNPAKYRLPSNLQFLAYEHSWSPDKGDAMSVAACVAEIKNIQSRLPAGFPLWPCEWNLNPTGSKIVEQARAMAALPGIVGIGGPI